MQDAPSFDRHLKRTPNGGPGGPHHQIPQKGDPTGRPYLWVGMGLGKGGRGHLRKSPWPPPPDHPTKLLYSSRYFRAETFQEKSWLMAWTMIRGHRSLLAKASRAVWMAFRKASGV